MEISPVLLLGVFFGSLNTNIATAALPEVPAVQGGHYHPKLVTREFLRSQNTNIVTLTLLEVPSAQVTSKTPNQRVVILHETPGDEVDTTNPWRRETTLILITLGTGYLEERCRRYIRVHQPRKLPSNEFRLIMFQILTKLQGDDINTVYPGHQVLLRVLPSLYSCSATQKTP
ncbi:hypothetical protein TSAR_015632 [Trichomalopsis sarcophagae]|uniref:Uncharacterized protein n=1 Tax=Trichomalopsis sarcophagae TaxID=543379 RepID=A0A232EZ52_9HYME|nr:hypothetical protein TSAR_015632 [Trichomalopsis sarcophagae]